MARYIGSMRSLNISPFLSLIAMLRGDFARSFITLTIAIPAIRPMIAIVKIAGIIYLDALAEKENPRDGITAAFFLFFLIF